MPDALLRFRGLVDGVVADVAIHADHIAWELRPGLFLRLVRETKVIPLRLISSVTTSRDGLLWSRVRLTATGNTIEFQVPHDVAARVREVVVPIVLAGPGASPARPAPAEPPLPPAAWYPDPAGTYALRWWDGERWTGHLRPLAHAHQRAC